jgi:hypothetical protein
MESRELSQEEHGFRKLLKRKLLGLASLERTVARQISRITWLSEGDACTKIFTCMPTIDVTRKSSCN